MKEKVLLAYSGGLDTAVICKWLVLEGYAVTAYIADVGQKEDLAEIAEKARAAGAEDVIVDDLRAKFVREFVFPALSFQAYYEGRYLLGTALARPVIALGMAQAALARNIRTLAHGATGKGNDQVRFELAFYALLPNVTIIAPWREQSFYQLIKGRQEAIAFAQKHGIPIKATPAQPWSSDANLMHISFEAGMLEDAGQKPQKDMFTYTKSPQSAPDKAITLALTFAAGIPVALNGDKLAPVELLARLNALGGEHAIGRIDIVETRFVGMKSRGVYETPGTTILYHAARDAQCFTLAGDLLALKDKLAIDFAAYVYKGMWFSPAVKALLAFLASAQAAVDATVTLELYKGNITIIGRTAPNALYDERIASMEDDKGAYQAEDATGFIRLHALPFKKEQERDPTTLG